MVIDKQGRPRSDIVASDQALYCLLTLFSTKKLLNRPATPKTINGLVQNMTVEESTSIEWDHLQG